MPLDPKEFEKVFANHFETIAPEQFLDNLKEACPYLFSENSISPTTEGIDNNEDFAEFIITNDDRVRHI